MYWIICDYPMCSNWAYVNYANWDSLPGAYGLMPTTGRWRGNPNDSYRTLDTALGDYSYFLGKYQSSSAVSHDIDADETKKENAVPTPTATFDLTDINNAGAPQLYIAHDVANSAQRPTWLTASYTAMGKQLYTGGGLTWDVYETTLSSSTAGIGDSTGWISDGGFLASLAISQSAAGVTQTVTLAHDLAVNTVPTFNVTAGSVVIDIGNYWLQTPPNVVIPSNVTVQINGGVLGGLPGDISTGDITIQASGKVSGTGTLNPGRGDYVIEDGGTLEVGAGLLSLNFPYGNTFRWRGAITGNGTNSMLNLAADLLRGQLKGIEDMAGNVNASIDGIVGLSIYHNYDDMTFGRFADASKINLRSTTLTLYNSKQVLWEAQTLTDDVVDDPANIDFKLGGYTPYNNLTLKLVDTGAVADDFVYIGQLQGLNVTHNIDLNGIALLTDMDQASLQAFVTAVAIVNTGAGGAPTVKSVKMHSNPGIMWYLAPANIEIPDPLPLGTIVIIR